MDMAYITLGFVLAGDRRNSVLSAPVIMTSMDIVQGCQLMHGGGLHRYSIYKART